MIGKCIDLGLALLREPKKAAVVFSRALALSERLYGKLDYQSVSSPVPRPLASNFS
jgi:hypothetical protein